MRNPLAFGLEGPLEPYAEAFAKQLREQGYAPRTVQDKLHVVAKLSHWLEEHQLPVEVLNGQRVCAFLQEFQKEERRAYHGDPTTLRGLLKQLSDDGVIAEPSATVDEGAQAEIVQEFSRYLTQERGLSAATLDNYVVVVRRFLTHRFGEGSVDLAALQAHDLTGFVLAQAHRLSPKPAQLMVTALRSFLRFLYQRGQIAVDLAAAVPTVADWRLARVPKYLQPEQVERLLESCDQGTVVGQRDYSILLLLARLGLRAGEVVHLHLEDIDWTEGLLTVRGKGGRWRQLPLPVDVGEAVARYLRWGRPPCTSRRVFVRMRAPRAGFASSVAIDCIVSRALARAGLNPPSRGAHLLRHSMATGMLRSGASLAEIGQLLGHRLPQSTEIYAKVDERALADLAQPWPGGTP
jgi:site-specific recombinase XerD